ncbi:MULTISPECIES: hypothetical protein [Brevundimonas]|uniref:hypothetical protein n=1 Tax=Brevundimonas sp. UBA7507 TaxID=1946137 RepID=UPI00258035D5|nr:MULTISPECIES: hypothetical protein [Brevundimonas]
MIDKREERVSDRLQQTLQSASLKVNADRQRAESIRSNWVRSDMASSAAGVLRKVG